MAVNNPPANLRGPETGVARTNVTGTGPFPHSAALYRRMWALPWAAEGVVMDVERYGSGSLAVTANATPNMAVAVAQGEAVVVADGQSAAGDGRGAYLFTSAGETQVSIAPPSASARVDLVVAEVIDETYTGTAGSSAARLRAVNGIPGAGAPALPDTAIPLAEVTVQPSDTTVTAARVVDRRVRAKRQLESRLEVLEAPPASAVNIAVNSPFYNLTSPLRVLSRPDGSSFLSGVIGTGQPLAANTDYLIGTLPAGHRPAYIQIANAPFGTGGPDLQITLHPDGRIIGRCAAAVGASAGTGLYLTYLRG